MARFLTYSTYDNEDVRGMTEAEYQANGVDPANFAPLETV